MPKHYITTVVSYCHGWPARDEQIAVTVLSFRHKIAYSCAYVVWNFWILFVANKFLSLCLNLDVCANDLFG